MSLLKHDAIAHGGVKAVLHPDLGVPISGQTAIRYLRFGRKIRIDSLELPLQAAPASGRWVPLVPTHPAHLVISTLDRGTGRWIPVKEVELPPDPRISGAGLSQEVAIEKMEEHFATVRREVRHAIGLGGLETDHLRVECDREHPAWPNHGECNGGPFNVPFGILNGLKAHGEPAGSEPAQAVRGPLLSVGPFAPRAPEGMAVRDLPDQLRFESEWLAVGFSLRRPLLMHLGWDAWGGGGARRNRLSLRRMDAIATGGLSGPLIRGFDVDYASHLWTGSVDVDGNTVCYRVHPECGGIEITARFTVHADRIELDLAQHGEVEWPVLEAEAWRLAWDLRAGMTATAGLPTLSPGRNGDVRLPAFFAADGQGCLSCRQVEGDPGARLQTESYRPQNTRTDGFVLATRSSDGACMTVPAGIRRAVFELAVTAFEPQKEPSAVPMSPGVRRHWGSVFSCFRPELGGFSNHAASVNCHVNQWAPVELASCTARPADGPDPLALARFTVGRALMDGGGYGYHRNLYLDSDPVLVSMAGRLHQAGPDAAWLRTVQAGLRAAFERMRGNVGEEGLVVCRALSGNTGSHRWSCNAMDVIGFGHIDAYVNAWYYRAFRNASPLFRALGDAERAALADTLAAALREAYAPALVNPETGWVAGWRSRDGVLHDYAFPWINGPAIAFGLLDKEQACRALRGLEALRRSQFGSARLGMPGNLLPIASGDQMISSYASMGGQPSFEIYTDGGTSGSAGYYLRALAVHGFRREADTLAAELDEGYDAGLFTGAIGGGQEFLSWEGLPCGYEGTLIVRLDSLYAIAIQKDILKPFAPEWWPAGA